MARVIKGQKPSVESVVPSESVRLTDDNRIISKDLFRQSQMAKEILKNGETERKNRLKEGKLKAAQLREESVAKAAAQAFALASEEAIEIFRRRAEHFDQLQSSVRTLVDEIITKIMGSGLSVSSGEIDKVVQKGIDNLRAQRQLKLYFPTGRLSDLRKKDADLFKHLDAQPDIALLEVSDVTLGFVRVATDVGAGLCAESVALSALKGSPVDA